MERTWPEDLCLCGVISGLPGSQLESLLSCPGPHRSQGSNKSPPGDLMETEELDSLAGRLAVTSQSSVPVCLFFLHPHLVQANNSTPCCV